MKNPLYLRNLLFIDIETVSSVAQFSMLSEDMQTLWLRKMNRFDQVPVQNIEDAYAQQAALFAEFGKIIVIGVGYFTQTNGGETFFRVKSLANTDEKQLLAEFKELLETKFTKRKVTPKLVAHNGKEFDFPYLCRRMLIHQIPLPDVLNIGNMKPWDVPHIDTIDMWRFGDRKNYTSLKMLAVLFGVEPAKQTLDGSMINQVYYEENDIAKISAYCRNDVAVLAQVYLALCSLPPIPTANIIEVA